MDDMCLVWLLLVICLAAAALLLLLDNNNNNVTLQSAFLSSLRHTTNGVCALIVCAQCFYGVNVFS